MLAGFSFFIIVFIDSLIVYLVYRALRRYSLVASPSFINHLPWLHGIVKCQSDANFNLRGSSRTSGYFLPTVKFGHTFITSLCSLIYWDAHARHNQQRPLGFININVKISPTHTQVWNSTKWLIKLLFQQLITKRRRLTFDKCISSASKGQIFF